MELLHARLTAPSPLPDDIEIVDADHAMLCKLDQFRDKALIDPIVAAFADGFAFVVCFDACERFG